jgi:excisionase family DNA binding protein
MRTLKLATEDRLHSAESAAELLGVRPSTIRSWWSTRKLPRVKIGRLSRVPESALLSLIQTQPNKDGE